jgi:hypothetical protein
MLRSLVKLITYCLFFLSALQVTSAYCYERTHKFKYNYIGNVYVVIEVEGGGGGARMGPLNKITLSGKVVWGPHVGAFEHSIKAQPGKQLGPFAIVFKKDGKGSQPLTVNVELSEWAYSTYKVKSINFYEGNLPRGYTRMSFKWGR